MGTLSEYMVGRPEYRTVVPMVVVRLLGGDEEYIKGEGKRVPANAHPQQIEQLLELGLIERIEAAQ